MTHMTERSAYREEETTNGVANPTPLGLIILALATAMIGASFARFLIPVTFLGMQTVVAPVIIYSGVILILAGMWAFRRNTQLAAILFSAYGGFLIALGVLFLPTLGPLTLFGANTVAFNHALGLLFLCWTITCGVLLLGAFRTNMLLITVLGCLFLSFLFLTIGELANANRVLLAIGGWLGILCALLAWYAALAAILRSAHSPYHLPMSDTRPTQHYGHEPAV